MDVPGGFQEVGPFFNAGEMKLAVLIYYDNLLRRVNVARPQ